MALLRTQMATNRQAHGLSPRLVAPLKARVPTLISSLHPPRMAIKRIITSASDNRLTHKLITVIGLIFISAALCFDYSISSQLTSNLSAPLRFVSTTLRLTSSEMPSTHKSKAAKPPSKKQLGNAGWTLIHSIAANYPQNPSTNDQHHAKAFLRSISKLYPCKRCRQHFEKHLAASPPDLSSRDHFMLWACGAHNAVNRRQGKTEFPCRMSKLEQRWGDCGCQLKSGTKK